MKLALLNGAAILFLTLSAPAYAQESPAAGDACTAGESGHSVQTGGPEDPDGDFLVCDGSTWNRFLGYTTGGILRVGEVAAVTALPGGGSSLWTEDSGNVYRDSGSVGIGTTSPTDALTVGSASTTGTKQIAVSTALANQAALVFKTGSTWYSGVGRSAGTQGLGFWTGANGTERMVITDTGSVGIGTTSLGTTQPRLAVVGDTSHVLDVYRSGLAANAGRWGVQVGGNGRLHFLTQNDDGTEISGGEKLTILRDGNVGVGTTSPTADLHIGATGAIGGDPPISLGYYAASWGGEPACDSTRIGSMYVREHNSYQVLYFCAKGGSSGTWAWRQVYSSASN